MIRIVVVVVAIGCTAILGRPNDWMIAAFVQTSGIGNFGNIGRLTSVKGKGRAKQKRESKWQDKPSRMTSTRV